MIVKNRMNHFMTDSIWIKMHGGATHFPIALVFASTLCDLGSSLLSDNQNKTRRAGLRAAGAYTLALGALGALGSVFSGLVISHGEIYGQGNLGRHHLWVWPAFGLLMALAAWRMIVGNQASHRSFKVYLVFSALTAGLMGAAGYWGGELLLNG
jgi:uncharacterized membrane protein